MTTMFDIMRYNGTIIIKHNLYNYDLHISLGYKIGDPYAEGSPINAICSRGDLMSVPMAGGCTDTKVCSRV